MKKISFSIIFLLLPLIIFCQEYGLGVRAGYNYATSSISEIITGKDSMPAPDPSGVSGAFMLDLGITKNFSIETDFQFGENETELTIDSLSGGKVIENGIVTTRLDIPVLGKLRFGSQVLKINLFAGPNFSFQRSKHKEERIFEAESEEVETNKTEIDKSSFKSYDYRNIAGFGVSIHLNQYVLFADYRYIFDFNKLESIRQEGLIDSRGANLGVGIGYYW